MSDRIRVALLSPCYWPEVRRGSERFTRELADGLLERGHRPRLITSHAGRPTRTVEDGLPVSRVWRPPAGRLERRGYEEYLTHVPFSYASLVGGDDELAHAVYPTDALAAGRWARRTGRPAVFSLMGVPHRRSLADRRGRMAIMDRAMGEASAVVVLTEAAAAACRRWLGREVRVISPGVNLERFSPGRPRRPEPTIVCAAAIEEPRKRVGLLVEAFGLVRRERPDARLVLNRPVDSARRTPAAGVEFADLDDRAALADAYATAWVSALPSRGEAFGLVLAEALACGTPCVGSNDGGIPEVVDRPEIGRLFDGEEPRSLAVALLEALELAEDPGTAAACRARAAEFSTDRCTERYVELYRDLLAGRDAT